MSKRYVVAYTAPVWVHVREDEDGIEVTEVSVGDEFLNLDEGFGTGGVVTYPDFGFVGLGEAEEVLAAIDEVDWPAWSFG